MSELRIIGGNAKGRKIKSCKGLIVRPLLSRIKKSLFDILEKKIYGCNFLDIFSGTGSIGLEAISRGARYVAFIEKNPEPLKILNYNINLLGFQEKSRVLKGDASLIIKNLNENFDIIFLDPPFAFSENLIESLLTLIADNNILKNEGNVIIHRPSYKSLIDKAGNLICSRKEKYGQNILSFYSID